MHAVRVLQLRIVNRKNISKPARGGVFIQSGGDVIRIGSPFESEALGVGAAEADPERRGGAGLDGGLKSAGHLAAEKHAEAAANGHLAITLGVVAEADARAEIRPAVRLDGVVSITEFPHRKGHRIEQAIGVVKAGILGGLLSLGYEVAKRIVTQADVEREVAANAPIVLNEETDTFLNAAEFAVTELAVLTVTALKALVPLPEIIVAPPNVNVPAVKPTVPSFSRLPFIPKLTALFKVFPFATVTSMNVLVPAPNSVEFPLNKIVPPL